MNITRRTHGRCAFAGLVALVIACHDATRPPESGSIRITTVTTGFDADADGYVVTVDSGATHALEPNGSLTLDAVPVGTTNVRLDGLATNCTAANGTNRRITVVPGQLTMVDFAITCIARAGTLTVSVTTSGIDLPPTDMPSRSTASRNRSA